MKIELESNPAALKVVHELCLIGLKAHANNPSPVDIKQQLAELPVNMLEQIAEDIARTLEPHKVYM